MTRTMIKKKRMTQLDDEEPPCTGAGLTGSRVSLLTNKCLLLVSHLVSDGLLLLVDFYVHLKACQ